MFLNLNRRSGQRPTIVAEIQIARQGHIEVQTPVRQTPEFFFGINRGHAHPSDRLTALTLEHNCLERGTVLILASRLLARSEQGVQNR